MELASLKRSFFQRLFGICVTKEPADASCWKYINGRIEIQTNRTPELSTPGNAIRLESKSLPDRILVMRGDDSKIYAFRNKCEHMGRRIDPVPGSQTLQCCSVSKSTYTYQGNVIYGPAGKPLTRYPVEEKNGLIMIQL